MIRVIRARRKRRMLMYYAALTAFFIGAASLTRCALRHGHQHCYGHSVPVPESVAGKGIDEIVDAEEAELTEDMERFAKPLYKDAPQDQNVEI